MPGIMRRDRERISAACQESCAGTAEGSARRAGNHAQEARKDQHGVPGIMRREHGRIGAARQESCGKISVGQPPRGLLKIQIRETETKRDADG